MYSASCPPTSSPSSLSKPRAGEFCTNTAKIRDQENSGSGFYRSPLYQTDAGATTLSPNHSAGEGGASQPLHLGSAYLSAAQGPTLRYSPSERQQQCTGRCVARRRALHLAAATVNDSRSAHSPSARSTRSRQLAPWPPASRPMSDWRTDYAVRLRPRCHGLLPLHWQYWRSATPIGGQSGPLGTRHRVCVCVCRVCVIN